MTILCVGTHLALMAVLETNMPLLLNIEHDNDRMASGKPCTHIYARVMSYLKSVQARQGF